MRRVSVATRNELVDAVRERYVRGGRAEKARILDEFVAVSGFHRKHAMRLLRKGPSPSRSGPRPDRRIYDDAVREALIVIWEASDRICGKRLKALVPILVEAMERHGHLRLTAEIRTRLLTMSAATIDRVLGEARETAGGRARRHSAASTALRRSIPIRTFSDWQDPPPGFVEADLVAHSGPVASGSFIQTLCLTDIASGWTECAPLLVREQKLLSEVLTELRRLLPFKLLGFDTDNDSVFLN
ncbi:MAG: transposase, partial [Mesorhizobium sp.]